jgi:hypothetical protein
MGVLDDLFILEREGWIPIGHWCKLDPIFACSPLFCRFKKKKKSNAL